MSKLISENNNIVTVKVTYKIINKDLDAFREEIHDNLCRCDYLGLDYGSEIKLVDDLIYFTYDIESPDEEEMKYIHDFEFPESIELGLLHYGDNYEEEEIMAKLFQYNVI